VGGAGGGAGVADGECIAKELEGAGTESVRVGSLTMPCIRRDMESAGVYMHQIMHSHASLLCSTRRQVPGTSGLFKKTTYHGIVHWVLNSTHWASLLVTPCFHILPRDCTRAGSAIVTVVTCESDDGVFETGGRSKARDAETSDDEGLRDALQTLSIY
jgi:hypothetical protein